MKIDGLSAYQVHSSVQTGKSDSHQSSVSQVEQQKTFEQLDQHNKGKTGVGNKNELSKDEAAHIVNGINEFLKPHFTSLKFELHEDLNRYYVQVVDQETKEVVREIPPRELLDFYAEMTKYLGLFIDEKL